VSVLKACEGGEPTFGKWGYEVPELNAKLRRIGLVWATVLTLLIPAIGWAQDGSSPSEPAASSGTVPAARAGAIGGTLAAIGSSGSADDGSATTSTVPPVQELGHGSWLGPSLSPLHWGSLYIGSFSFLQSYDDIRNAGLGNAIFRSSVFQTSVVYDTAIRGNHLALQWNPQVVVVNGRFLNSLNNENAGFAYASQFTPRLTLTVQDSFAYLPISNVYGVGVFSPSTASDLHSVQNTFLEGPGSWLTNTVSVSVAYDFSERTTLTVTPSFNYVHSYNPDSLIFLGSKQYGASVSVNHKLSTTKSVGLFYSENLVKFDNNRSTIPYTSFGGSLSDEITPTWFVNAAIAAAPSSYGSAKTIWSMSGQIDVEKRFQTSSVSLAYTRGLSLNQYSSQHFTDRADLSYSIQLTRRVNAGAGIGHQGVSGPPAFSGTYGSATLGYQLLPSVSLTGSYIYANQAGDNIQIYTQTRKSGFITVSWMPPRLLH
jgi:hypothetical protein